MDNSTDRAYSTNVLPSINNLIGTPTQTRTGVFPLGEGCYYPLSYRRIGGESLNAATWM